MFTTLLALCVWAAIFCGAGAYISTEKGRNPAEGVVLGLLFGPIGLIVAAVLPTVVQGRAKPDDKPAVAAAWAKPNPWAPVEEEERTGEFVDTRLPSRKSIRTASVISSNEDDLMRRESRLLSSTESDPTSRQSPPSGPSRDLRA